MLLQGDIKLDSADFINLVVQMQQADHIPSDELHSFKEGELLTSLSGEELEKRLDKSFNINVSIISDMLKRDISNSELVKLTHMAISCANSKLQAPLGGKRKPLNEEDACTAKKKKATATDDVSLFLLF